MATKLGDARRCVVELEAGNRLSSEDAVPLRDFIDKALEEDKALTRRLLHIREVLDLGHKAKEPDWHEIARQVSELLTDALPVEEGGADGVVELRQVERLHDRLVLRRLQLYPVEWATADHLAEWADLDVADVEVALARLHEAGHVQIDTDGRVALTSEAREWAMHNSEKLIGSGKGRPEDVELLVDANERAEQATRHAGELEQQVEHLQAELERRPDGDELLERAERACTALRVLDALLGLDVSDPDRTLESLRMVLDRFKREDGTERPGAVPLSIVAEFLKGYTASVEEKVAGLEERAAELQALVDDHMPAVAELLEQLDGEEPTWWVKATRALDQLRAFRDSPLAVPPALEKARLRK